MMKKGAGAAGWLAAAGILAFFCSCGHKSSSSSGAGSNANTGGNVNTSTSTVNTSTSSAGGGAGSAGSNVLTASVTVTVIGNGMVNSLPAGIVNCSSSGGTCTASFTAGAAVALMETPDSGQAFYGWSLTG